MQRIDDFEHSLKVRNAYFSEKNRKVLQYGGKRGLLIMKKLEGCPFVEKFEPGIVLIPWCFCFLVNDKNLLIIKAKHDAALSDSYLKRELSAAKRHTKEHGLTLTVCTEEEFLGSEQKSKEE